VRNANAERKNRKKREEKKMPAGMVAFPVLVGRLGSVATCHQRKRGLESRDPKAGRALAK
jgi:hypothetical protein